MLDNADISVEEVTFFVEYEFFGAITGAREGGLQLEPDEEASIEIQSISIDGQDLHELLNESTIESIEQSLLGQHE